MNIMPWFPLNKRQSFGFAFVHCSLWLAVCSGTLGLVHWVVATYVFWLGSHYWYFGERLYITVTCCHAVHHLKVPLKKRNQKLSLHVNLQYRIFTLSTCHETCTRLRLIAFCRSFVSEKYPVYFMVIPLEIYSSPESHHASYLYPTMHHCVTEMCTHVHISVQNDACWYVGQLHREMCQMSQMDLLGIHTITLVPVK